MCRRILHLAAGSAVALFTTSQAGAAKIRPVDKRLLGTWRSDKERTLAQWKYRKEVPENVRERFEKIFGKYTLRFTETHIHTEFDEMKDVVPYSIVSRDANSAVIAWHENKERSLQHIHFEDDDYYALTGYNVEFYKRIA